MWGVFGGKRSDVSSRSDGSRKKSTRSSSSKSSKRDGKSDKRSESGKASSSRSVKDDDDYDSDQDRRRDDSPSRSERSKRSRRDRDSKSSVSRSSNKRGDRDDQITNASKSSVYYDTKDDQDTVVNSRSSKYYDTKDDQDTIVTSRSSKYYDTRDEQDALPTSRSSKYYDTKDDQDAINTPRSSRYYDTRDDQDTIATSRSSKYYDTKDDQDMVATSRSSKYYDTRDSGRDPTVTSRSATRSRAVRDDYEDTPSRTPKSKSSSSKTSSASRSRAINDDDDAPVAPPGPPPSHQQRPNYNAQSSVPSSAKYYDQQQQQQQQFPSSQSQFPQQPSNQTSTGGGSSSRPPPSSYQSSTTFQQYPAQTTSSSQLQTFSSSQSYDYQSTLPNQFPGQVPESHSVPFQPPNNPLTEHKYGLAADYYNDTGESVAFQPGVRPGTPMMVGNEPHLMAALPNSNPPSETGDGAAAEFYSEGAALQAGVAPSQASSSTIKPSKPYKNSKPPKQSTSSSYSQSLMTSAAATAATGGSFASSSNNQSTYTPPGRPPKFSAGQSNIPLVAAGLAGAAGLGAAAWKHHHDHGKQSAHQSSSSSSASVGNRPRPHKHSRISYVADRPSQTASGSNSQRYDQQTTTTTGFMETDTRTRERFRDDDRGPLRRLIDWWADYEDVRRMEEYTEYIGVCKYCFDPHSTPRDAPRKHHYRRRPSREFRRDRIRVEKESRYASESDSRRRNRRSGLGLGTAAALAGSVGLAAAARRAHHEKRGDDRRFEKSSSISGRRESEEIRRRRSTSPEGQSSVSRGVVHRDSHGNLFVAREKDGKHIRRVDSHRRSRSRSRSRSHSASRRRKEEALLAAGAIAGGGVGLAEGVKHHKKNDHPSSTGTARLERKSSRRSSSSSSSSGNQPGFFASMFSPNSKRKAKSKARRRKESFYSQTAASASSFSSVDSGLVYGANRRRSTRTKSRSRSPTKKPVTNKTGGKVGRVLPGMAAAAAIVGAVEEVKRHQRKKNAELIAVREVKTASPKQTTSQKVNERKSSLNEEDDWESASEDEYSSDHDSALAFGYDDASRRMARRSQESLSSVSSGGDKWNWRWGSKKDREKKRNRRSSAFDQDAKRSDNVSPSEVAAPLPYVSPKPVLQERNQSLSSRRPSQAPMKFVDPVPVIDAEAPTRTAEPPRRATTENVPLRQPQPVSPVKTSSYDAKMTQGSIAQSKVKPADDDDDYTPRRLKRVESAPVEDPFAPDGYTLRRRRTEPTMHGALTGVDYTPSRDESPRERKASLKKIAEEVGVAGAVAGTIGLAYAATRNDSDETSKRRRRSTVVRFAPDEANEELKREKSRRLESSEPASGKKFNNATYRPEPKQSFEPESTFDEVATRPARSYSLPESTSPTLPSAETPRVWDYIVSESEPITAPNVPESRYAEEKPKEVQSSATVETPHPDFSTDIDSLPAVTETELGKRSTEEQRTDAIIDPAVPPPKRDVEDFKDKSTDAYHVRHYSGDARQSDEPIFDEDLMDPSFFKRRKKAKSERESRRQTRTAAELKNEFRNRSVSPSAPDEKTPEEVFENFEKKYREEQVSQADFFKPLDIADDDTKVTDNRVDADFDFENQSARPRSESWTSSGHPWPVPQLNVIPATPPVSNAASVAGDGSRDASPNRGTGETEEEPNITPAPLPSVAEHEPSVDEPPADDTYVSRQSTRTEPLDSSEGNFGSQAGPSSDPKQDYRTYASSDYTPAEPSAPQAPSYPASEPGNNGTKKKQSKWASILGGSNSRSAPSSSVQKAVQAFQEAPFNKENDIISGYADTDEAETSTKDTAETSTKETAEYSTEDKEPLSEKDAASIEGVIEAFNNARGTKESDIINDYGSDEGEAQILQRETTRTSTKSHGSSKGEKSAAFTATMAAFGAGAALARAKSKEKDSTAVQSSGNLETDGEPEPQRESTKMPGGFGSDDETDVRPLDNASTNTVKEHEHDALGTDIYQPYPEGSEDTPAAEETADTSNDFISEPPYSAELEAIRKEDDDSNISRQLSRDSESRGYRDVDNWDDNDDSVSRQSRRKSKSWDNAEDDETIVSTRSSKFETYDDYASVSRSASRTSDYRNGDSSSQKSKSKKGKKSSGSSSRRQSGREEDFYGADTASAVTDSYRNGESYENGTEKRSKSKKSRSRGRDDDDDKHSTISKVSSRRSEADAYADEVDREGINRLKKDIDSDRDVNDDGDAQSRFALQSNDAVVAMRAVLGTSPGPDDFHPAKLPAVESFAGKRNSRDSYFPSFTARKSIDDFPRPEGYDSIPEMVRLPDSRPDSPYDEEESLAVSTASPPELTPVRTQSSTAVPLRFRRPPISPGGVVASRETPVSPPIVEQQSTPGSGQVYGRTRQNRPHSTEFKSGQFRPLWLVETNRKTPEPDSDLPSLPSSRTTSRAPSVHETDNEFDYESALESPPRQRLPDFTFMPRRQTDRDEEQDLLDSQQTTPRAASFPDDPFGGEEVAAEERSTSPIKNAYNDEDNEAIRRSSAALAAAIGVTGLTGAALLAREQRDRSSSRPHSSQSVRRIDEEDNYLGKPEPGLVPEAMEEDLHFPDAAVAKQPLERADNESEMQAALPLTDTKTPEPESTERELAMEESERHKNEQRMLMEHEHDEDSDLFHDVNEYHTFYTDTEIASSVPLPAQEAKEPPLSPYEIEEPGVATKVERSNFDTEFGEEGGTVAEANSMQLIEEEAGRALDKPLSSPDEKAGSAQELQPKSEHLETVDLEARPEPVHDDTATAQDDKDDGWIAPTTSRKGKKGKGKGKNRKSKQLDLDRQGDGLDSTLSASALIASTLIGDATVSEPERVQAEATTETLAEYEPELVSEPTTTTSDSLDEPLTKPIELTEPVEEQEAEDAEWTVLSVSSKKSKKGKGRRSRQIDRDSEETAAVPALTEPISEPSKLDEPEPGRESEPIPVAESTVEPAEFAELVEPESMSRQEPTTEPMDISEPIQVQQDEENDEWTLPASSKKSKKGKGKNKGKKSRQSGLDDNSQIIPQDAITATLESERETDAAKTHDLEVEPEQKSKVESELKPESEADINVPSEPFSDPIELTQPPFEHLVAPETSEKQAEKDQEEEESMTPISSKKNKKSKGKGKKSERLSFDEGEFSPATRTAFTTPGSETLESREIAFEPEGKLMREPETMSEPLEPLELTEVADSADQQAITQSDEGLEAQPFSKKGKKSKGKSKRVSFDEGAFTLTKPTDTSNSDLGTTDAVREVVLEPELEFTKELPSGTELNSESLEPLELREFAEQQADIPDDDEWTAPISAKKGKKGKGKKSKRVSFDEGQLASAEKTGFSGAEVESTDAREAAIEPDVDLTEEPETMSEPSKPLELTESIEQPADDELIAPTLSKKNKKGKVKSSKRVSFDEGELASAERTELPSAEVELPDAREPDAERVGHPEAVSEPLDFIESTDQPTDNEWTYLASTQKGKKGRGKKSKRVSFSEEELAPAETSRPAADVEMTDAHELALEPKLESAQGPEFEPIAESLESPESTDKQADDDYGEWAVRTSSKKSKKSKGKGKRAKQLDTEDEAFSKNTIDSSEPEVEILVTQIPETLAESEPQIVTEPVKLTQEPKEADNEEWSGPMTSSKSKKGKGKRKDSKQLDFEEEAPIGDSVGAVASGNGPEAQEADNQSQELVAEPPTQPEAEPLTDPMELTGPTERAVEDQDDEWKSPITPKKSRKGKGKGKQSKGLDVEAEALPENSIDSAVPENEEYDALAQNTVAEPDEWPLNDQLELTVSNEQGTVGQDDEWESPSSLKKGKKGKGKGKRTKELDIKEETHKLEAGTESAADISTASPAVETFEPEPELDQKPATEPEPESNIEESSRETEIEELSNLGETIEKSGERTEPEPELSVQGQDFREDDAEDWAPPPGSSKKNKKDKKRKSSSKSGLTPIIATGAALAGGVALAASASGKEDDNAEKVPEDDTQQSQVFKAPIQVEDDEWTVPTKVGKKNKKGKGKRQPLAEEAMESNALVSKDSIMEDMQHLPVVESEPATESETRLESKYEHDSQLQRAPEREETLDSDFPQNANAEKEQHADISEIAETTDLEPFLESKQPSEFEDHTQPKSEESGMPDAPEILETIGLGPVPGSKELPEFENLPERETKNSAMPDAPEIFETADMEPLPASSSLKELEEVGELKREPGLEELTVSDEPEIGEATVLQSPLDESEAAIGSQSLAERVPGSRDQDEDDEWASVPVSMSTKESKKGKGKTKKSKSQQLPDFDDVSTPEIAETTQMEPLSSTPQDLPEAELEPTTSAASAREVEIDDWAPAPSTGKKGKKGKKGKGKQSFSEANFAPEDMSRASESIDVDAAIEPDAGIPTTAEAAETVNFGQLVDEGPLTSEDRTADRLEDEWAPVPASGKKNKNKKGKKSIVETQFPKAAETIAEVENVEPKTPVDVVLEVAESAGILPLEPDTETRNVSKAKVLSGEEEEREREEENDVFCEPEVEMRDVSEVIADTSGIGPLAEPLEARMEDAHDTTQPEYTLGQLSETADIGEVKLFTETEEPPAQLKEKTPEYDEWASYTAGKRTKRNKKKSMSSKLAETEQVPEHEPEPEKDLEAGPVDVQEIAETTIVEPLPVFAELEPEAKSGEISEIAGATVLEPLGSSEAESNMTVQDNNDDMVPFTFTDRKNKKKNKKSKSFSEPEPKSVSEDVVPVIAETTTIGPLSEEYQELSQDAGVENDEWATFSSSSKKGRKNKSKKEKSKDQSVKPEAEFEGSTAPEQTFKVTEAAAVESLVGASTVCDKDSEGFTEIIEDTTLEPFPETEEGAEVLTEDSPEITETMDISHQRAVNEPVDDQSVVNIGDQELATSTSRKNKKGKGKKSMSQSFDFGAEIRDPPESTGPITVGLGPEAGEVEDYAAPEIPEIAETTGLEPLPTVDEAAPSPSAIQDDDEWPAPVPSTSKKGKNKKSNSQSVDVDTEMTGVTGAATTAVTAAAAAIAPAIASEFALNEDDQSRGEENWFSASSGKKTKKGKGKTKKSFSKISDFDVNTPSTPTDESTKYLAETESYAEPDLQLEAEQTQDALGQVHLADETSNTDRTFNEEVSRNTSGNDEQRIAEGVPVGDQRVEEDEWTSTATKKGKKGKNKGKKFRPISVISEPAETAQKDVEREPLQANEPPSNIGLYEPAPIAVEEIANEETEEYTGGRFDERKDEQNEEVAENFRLDSKSQTPLTTTENQTSPKHDTFDEQIRTERSSDLPYDRAPEEHAISSQTFDKDVAEETLYQEQNLVGEEHYRERMHNQPDDNGMQADEPLKGEELVGEPADNEFVEGDYPSYLDEEDALASPKAEELEYAHDEPFGHKNQEQDLQDEPTAVDGPLDHANRQRALVAEPGLEATFEQGIATDTDAQSVFAKVRTYAEDEPSNTEKTEHRYDEWAAVPAKQKKNKKGRKSRLQSLTSEDLALPSSGEYNTLTKTQSEPLATEFVAEPENLEISVDSGGPSQSEMSKVEPELVGGDRSAETMNKKGKKGKKGKEKRQSVAFDNNAATDGEEKLEGSLPEPIIQAKSGLGTADDEWASASSQKGKKGKKMRQSVAIDDILEPEEGKELLTGTEDRGVEPVEDVVMEAQAMAAPEPVKAVEEEQWDAASSKKRKHKSKNNSFSFDEPLNSAEQGSSNAADRNNALDGKIAEESTSTGSFQPESQRENTPNPDDVVEDNEWTTTSSKTGKGGKRRKSAAIGALAAIFESKHMASSSDAKSVKPQRGVAAPPLKGTEFDHTTERPSNQSEVEPTLQRLEPKAIFEEQTPETWDEEPTRVIDDPEIHPLSQTEPKMENLKDIETHRSSDEMDIDGGYQHEVEEPESNKDTMEEIQKNELAHPEMQDEKAMILDDTSIQPLTSEMSTSDIPMQDRERELMQTGEYFGAGTQSQASIGDADAEEEDELLTTIKSKKSKRRVQSKQRAWKEEPYSNEDNDQFKSENPEKDTTSPVISPAAEKELELERLSSSAKDLSNSIAREGSTEFIEDNNNDAFQQPKNKKGKNKKKGKRLSSLNAYESEMPQLFDEKAPDVTSKSDARVFNEPISEEPIRLDTRDPLHEGESQEQMQVIDNDKAHLAGTRPENEPGGEKMSDESRDEAEPTTIDDNVETFANKKSKKAKGRAKKAKEAAVAAAALGLSAIGIKKERNGKLMQAPGGDADIAEEIGSRLKETAVYEDEPVKIMETTDDGPQSIEQATTASNIPLPPFEEESVDEEDAFRGRSPGEEVKEGADSHHGQARAELSEFDERDAVLEEDQRRESFDETMDAKNLDDAVEETWNKEKDMHSASLEHSPDYEMLDVGEENLAGQHGNQIEEGISEKFYDKGEFIKPLDQAELGERRDMSINESEKNSHDDKTGGVFESDREIETESVKNTWDEDSVGESSATEGPRHLRDIKDNNDFDSVVAAGLEESGFDSSLIHGQLFDQEEAAPNTSDMHTRGDEWTAARLASARQKGQRTVSDSSSQDERVPVHRERAPVSSDDESEVQPTREDAEFDDIVNASLAGAGFDASALEKAQGYSGNHNNYEDNDLEDVVRRSPSPNAPSQLWRQSSRSPTQEAPENRSASSGEASADDLRRTESKTDSDASSASRRRRRHRKGSQAAIAAATGSGLAGPAFTSTRARARRLGELPGDIQRQNTDEWERSLEATEEGETAGVGSDGTRNIFEEANEFDEHMEDDGRAASRQPINRDSGYQGSVPETPVFMHELEDIEEGNARDQTDFFDPRLTIPRQGDFSKDERAIIQDRQEEDYALPPLSEVEELEDEDEPSQVDPSSKVRSSYLFKGVSSSPQGARSSPAQSRSQRASPMSQTITQAEMGEQLSRSRSISPDDGGSQMDDDSPSIRPQIPRTRPLESIAERSAETSPVRKQRRLSAKESDKHIGTTPDGWAGPSSAADSQEPDDEGRSLPRSTTSSVLEQQERGEASAARQEIANTRRPYIRSLSSDSSMAQDVRPPSALSARSNTQSQVQLPSRSPSAQSFHSRTASAMSNRSTTPSLRKVDRSTSDLRAANRRAETLVAEADTGAKIRDGNNNNNSNLEKPQNYEPLKGSGKERRSDMSESNIYEGWGDVPDSPRSPSRPPSLRKRQSLHIVDLESRLEQMNQENQSLLESHARKQTEVENTVREHREANRSLTESLAARDLKLRERDVEIQTIRGSLELLQQEAARLTAANQQLQENNRNLPASEDYATLRAEHDKVHSQWQDSSRQLEDLRQKHAQTNTRMDSMVEEEINAALEEKNAEIALLRNQLERAAEQIRSLQGRILAQKSGDDFLNARDEVYFGSACQQLCQHVQQWVLRFSKYSDSRACRVCSELNNEPLETRLDNVMLDGTDVDQYLTDRVQRRDVFMSVVMSMVWEFIFTRYLFGMDRDQRQKLKALEKTLGEVGPAKAVAQWRAITLTLLARRPAFAAQREEDTEAVVQEIYGNLAQLLPPPSNVRQQIQDSLRNVLKLAVELSIEMRTQRAEYIMLPPLAPKYDSNGDLEQKVYFSASLMNERSGNFASNDELESKAAIVRLVLFPLVVKKGNEQGETEDETVVCPAQVLISAPPKRRVSRMKSGALSMSQDNKSQQSIAPSVMDIDPRP